MTTLTAGDIRRELAGREMSRRHLMPFITYTFPQYRPRPHHLLIAGACEAVYNGQFDRLMIFVPPQYGKSEIASRRLPAWWLGKRPDSRLIMVSYAAELAYSFSRDARQLVGDDLYQNVFGRRSVYDENEWVDVDGNQKQVQLWGVGGHRGRVRAAGLGGGISGHSMDLGIIDDPVKDEAEAQSAAYRTRANEWYESAFYTRLAPGAPIVLIMTRWHEDDLAGYLLKKQGEGGDLWHVLRLPALAETNEQRAAWCDRHHVTPDRHITAENLGMVPEVAAMYGLGGLH
jgi:hypothetical protein